MFGSGSRKDRHRPPPMPEFDPTKPQYNSTPVIPIPPYLIAPNGFPPTNNVIPNPHPHSSTRRPLPPSRTGSFPSFPNSSPYSDSNTNPYDSDGPPVIPVSDGNGGYVLAAGFNPDGTVIPQPPQQQPQSMGSRHGQWAPPGPSTTYPYPPLYPAQAPPPPPPTRPSRATASGPSPWQPPMGPPPPYSSPYATPALHGPPPPPPKHNTTEMTRENLLAVLNHFSEMLEDYFDFEPLSSVNLGPGNGTGEGNSSSSNRPLSRPFSLQMAVHGGACMLLHQGLYSLSLNLPLGEQSSQSQQPTDSHGHYNSNGEKPPHMSQLPRRTTTRDIDIIFRCFIADYGGLGPPPNPGERARRNPSYPGEGQPNDPNPDSPTRVSHMDAASRMKACIRNTTRAFPGLGLDWMNADADVALPLATDPQTAQPFDPLHRSTFTAHNESVFTIYTSPNRRLTLVGVPPYWAIALKIARWGKRDWADVGILLRAGTILSGTRWTEDMLMEWLKKNCWAMGYSVWEARRIHEMKEKIHDAIEMIQGWEPGSPSHYPQPARPQVHAQAQAQAQERPTERGRDMTSRQQNPQDWGSTAQKKKSKSRARSRPRQRSLSTGPTEIFIPTEEDEYDAEYGGGYQDRDFEPRGRAHHRHHHSFHNQLMHPPPASHAPPPHSHSHGAPSGPLSQSTAIAPFFPQPQNHPGGSQNTRAWRRQTSRSRNRDNKKGKKAKQRDRQRRLEHQRREDRRSEWNMPPTDSESETESEESEDDSSEDDDEEDKENRDRRRAWIRENIYGPSKKRPTPLNLPNTFPPPPQGPAPAPAPPPFNPFVDQQRPPAMPQPQLQPHSQNSRQPSPFRRPPSPGEPPMDAGPAALAQYQFERQMLSLESERRREKQFRETIGRVAGRVMARANRGG